MVDYPKNLQTGDKFDIFDLNKKAAKSDMHNLRSVSQHNAPTVPLLME